MARSDEQLKGAKPELTDLASYRRLIELQKQMIELSQQHERSRRDYDALRDVVAREVAGQARGRQSTMGRMRTSAGKWLKRSPFALARQLFS
jgi:hypothetical protein